MMLFKGMAMCNLTETERLTRFFLFQLTEPMELKNESISFFCVIEGRMQASHGEASYIMKAGDVFLSSEAECWHLTPYQDTLILTVHFDYVFFHDSFGKDFPYLVCHPTKAPSRDNRRLVSALAALALSLINDPEQNRFLIMHELYSVFHLLKAEYLVLPDESATAGKQDQKLKQFIRYVQDSCTGAITLQDTADYMGYTPQYLSSFIKKNLDCTFNSYLGRCRMERAIMLIRFRTDTPARIAADCGFSNYSSFLKQFKEQYRMTPEELREEFQKESKNASIAFQPITEPSLVRDKLLNLVHFVEDEPKVIETPVTEHHTLDASCSTSYQKHWNRVINLGEALNFEKPRFREHLKQIQERFHFKYGRFANILELVDIFYDETTKHDRSRWVFDFTRVFAALDFMLSLELTPYLDFGGKPFDIYLASCHDQLEAHEAHLQYHSTVFEPFLVACINRYGFHRVTHWIFEYWMYYNRLMTQREDPKEYCRHFQDFYRTIKALLPDARVGGPGFNLFFPPEDLGILLREMNALELRPDFISLLFFAYGVPEHYAENNELRVTFTSDPELLHKQILSVYALLHDYYEEAPELYVAEYSTFVSPMNFVNDSLFQGSFILKQTLDTLGHLPVLSYWLATDYSMQYPDSAELLFGGNGLLTKDGIQKPGYHAFAFLSRLGDRLIGRGTNYIVTCTPVNEIQVILYHYTHFSEKYCTSPEDYTEMKNPSSAFREDPPLLIELDITNVRPGRYRISQYTLSEEHGSILNEWIRFDYSRHMGATETEHLKSICLPELLIGKEEVRDTIHISKTLGRNEAMLLIFHYMF